MNYHKLALVVVICCTVVFVACNQVAEQVQDTEYIHLVSNKARSGLVISVTNKLGASIYVEVHSLVNGGFSADSEKVFQASTIAAGVTRSLNCVCSDILHIKNATTGEALEVLPVWDYSCSWWDSLTKTKR